MKEALIFGNTFLLVFLLGLQSQVVNVGRRWFAFVVSFFIGACNLYLFKTLPNITEFSQEAAYLTGGPLGIVFSVWFFRDFLPKLRK